MASLLRAVLFGVTLIKKWVRQAGGVPSYTENMNAYMYRYAHGWVKVTESEGRKKVIRTVIADKFGPGVSRIIGDFMMEAAAVEMAQWMIIDKYYEKEEFWQFFSNVFDLLEVNFNTHEEARDYRCFRRAGMRQRARAKGNRKPQCT